MTVEGVEVGLRTGRVDTDDDVVVREALEEAGRLEAELEGVIDDEKET